MWIILAPKLRETPNEAPSGLKYQGVLNLDYLHCPDLGEGGHDDN